MPRMTPHIIRAAVVGGGIALASLLDMQSRPRTAPVFFQVENISGIAIPKKSEDIHKIVHNNIGCLVENHGYRKIVEMENEVLFERPVGADFKNDCKACNVSSTIEKIDGSVITMNWII